VSHTTGLKGILQRSDDMLLTYNIGKCLGAVLAVKGLVSHPVIVWEVSDTRAVLLKAAASALTWFGADPLPWCYCTAYRAIVTYIVVRWQDRLEMNMATRPTDIKRTMTEVADETTLVLEGVGRVSRQVVISGPLSVIRYIGDVFLVLTEAVSGIRETDLITHIRQWFLLGVQTFPIAGTTVGLSSAVFAYYTVMSLKNYGASGLVGGIVAITVVRETGPLIAGIMLTARAGSSIAAELGAMRASEQIDALRVMGLSPVRYLASSRILACTLMLPVLTVLSDLMGVAAGGLVASSNGVSTQQYITSIRNALHHSGSDIFEGLYKAMVFGCIVGVIGCNEGLNSTGGAAGVGSSTIRAVVLSLALIFLADLLITFTTNGGLAL